MTKLIQQLRQRLEQPLPGLEIQLKMTSRAFRDSNEIDIYKVPETPKKAGVMALLYQKENEWHTALMQRPPSEFAHGSQVSLPGGGLEQVDQTMADTALRETEEEFGVPRQNVNLLGALSQLYIPVSGYLVHPFVGFLDHVPTFTPDINEVAEIIEVPISSLLDPALRKTTQITTNSGFRLKDIPYFDLKGKVVWGATAMILSEFSHILEEIDALSF